MSFYQAMQLSAANLKPLIKSTEDTKLRKKYISALVVKNFLCILFCMIIITSFSILFGANNSIVGVVTVILLLTFRFSNLDFKTGQSAIALLFIFLIFSISPYLATIVGPIKGALINFISMMTIMILSCHNISLSNQSTLILSYLLLYGYEINNINDYVSRVFALLLGGSLVTIIFYCKNRKINFENTFKDIIRDINFSTDHTKWQFKLVLGVTIILLIGKMLNIPRVIWVGLAFMSIFQPDNKKIEQRKKTRYKFVIIGSLLYGIIYIIFPKELRGCIGIIGGLMAGFSATYSWQTSFNCFGALTSAVPIFGLWDAVVLRIINNIIAAVYTNVYMKIFDKIENKLLSINTVSKMG